jgi:hypothetical protein
MKKILSFQNTLSGSFSKTCPYCNFNCNLIFSGDIVSNHMWKHPNNKPETNNPYSMFVGGITNFDVYQCLRCGWWSFYNEAFTDMGTGPFTNYGSASLKEFNANDLELPIEVLRNELEKSAKLLELIHPKKMEELVGSILKDFINVEVHHCGASHDRGIDLLILKGETTIPVQVKRRSDIRKTESVRTVREMFGVMFRDNYRNAYVVSTADHFSRESIKEVNEVLRGGKCDSFELIDYHRFVDMIDVTKPLNKPAWTSAFRQFVNTREIDYYLQFMHKAI